MDLVTPGIGVIFWTVLIFSILLFLLGKFAWKPINNAIKNREDSIRSALVSADTAKEEMRKLQADNERIMKEARAERDNIMKEAREVKDAIIAEAREKADAEAKKLIENARKNIENEKASAINDIRKQVAKLSVDVAEAILRAELSDDKNRKKLVDRLVDDIKLN